MPLAAFPKCFLEQIVVEHTMTTEQWIDMAAEQLDIDGLEFWINFTPIDDPAHMTALRKQTEAHGLQIPMMCVSPDFTKLDPAERRQEVEMQIRRMEAT